mgnify:CR=1 FL=1
MAAHELLSHPAKPNSHFVQRVLHVAGLRLTLRNLHAYLLSAQCLKVDSIVDGGWSWPPPRFPPLRGTGPLTTDPSHTHTHTTRMRYTQAHQLHPLMPPPPQCHLGPDLLTAPPGARTAPPRYRSAPPAARRGAAWPATGLPRRQAAPPHVHTTTDPQDTQQHLPRPQPVVLNTPLPLPYQIATTRAFPLSALPLLSGLAVDVNIWSAWRYQATLAAAAVDMCAHTHTHTHIGPLDTHTVLHPCTARLCAHALTLHVPTCTMNAVHTLNMKHMSSLTSHQSL